MVPTLQQDSWLYHGSLFGSSGLALLPFSYASFMCMHFFTLSYYLHLLISIHMKIITKYPFMLFHFRKGLQDTTDSVSGSIVFKIYIVVIAIYAGIQLFWSSLARLPSCHRLINRFDNTSIVSLVKWIHQVNILSLVALYSILLFIIFFYL